MNHTKLHRRGFVLIVAVLVISMMSMLVVRMVIKLAVFHRVGAGVLQREQAKQIAWSGVAIATAQILKAPPQEEAAKMTEEEKKRFTLYNLLTFLNSWQQFTLTEDFGGTPASCALYISSEQGKYNLNALFDLQNKRLRTVPGLALVDERSVQAAKELPLGFPLFKAAEKVLKKHAEPLIDVSELYEEKDFSAVRNLFFMHPEGSWALTDFFTLDNPEMKLESWAVSSSMARLLGFKGPRNKISKKVWESFLESLKAREKNITIAFLELCYGTDHPPFPQEIIDLFRENFEPSTFSVISYGTYDTTTVKLNVILQLKREKSKDNVQQDTLLVKRVYWIFE